MSIFSKVSRSKLPSNVFSDLTYSNKYDMQPGVLYPVHVEEILPGDVFFGGHGAFIRSQPIVTPIFHNFNYSIRWFFVPNRIIWENFESFITNQEKGKKTPGLESPHVHPYLTGKTVQYNYLHDLMGLPPIPSGSGYVADYYTAEVPPNALPFRAYYSIWNEYFKDENTMDDLEFSIQDGIDETDYKLQRVSWKKDYFTSALPFAQRGEAVQMIGRVILGDPTNGQKWVDRNGDPIADSQAVFEELGDDGTFLFGEVQDPSYSQIANMDPNGTLEAAVEFGAIRRATALQRFLERSALGGNRYAELLLAHFGVRSADASLQRPQYLGGGTIPINISPVEQTSATPTGSKADASTPQGNLAGKGVGVGSMYFNKRTLFTEHGWLLGLAFIRPDADYCQGVNRHMVKRDRFDYFWPDFQNIGEQEIYNHELYVSGVAADNSGTFGYQSRYAHYKWHGNEVHGEFRSSLRSWVAPREFSELPTLSKEFIECDPDLSDNMAVSPETYPPFMVEAINVVKARRSMYYFNRGVL